MFEKYCFIVITLFQAIIITLWIFALTSNRSPCSHLVSLHNIPKPQLEWFFFKCKSSHVISLIEILQRLSSKIIWGKRWSSYWPTNIRHDLYWYPAIMPSPHSVPASLLLFPEQAEYALSQLFPQLRVHFPHVSTWLSRSCFRSLSTSLLIEVFQDHCAQYLNPKYSQLPALLYFSPSTFITICILYTLPMFFQFIVCFPLLKEKLSEDRNFAHFLLYPLAHSRPSMYTCWMNEWMR